MIIAGLAAPSAGRAIGFSGAKSSVGAQTVGGRDEN